MLESADPDYFVTHGRGISDRLLDEIDLDTLAALRSALEGKLSSGLDAQVLVPHPAGDAQKGAL